MTRVSPPVATRVLGAVVLRVNVVGLEIALAEPVTARRVGSIAAKEAIVSQDPFWEHPPGQA
jgi:hypothetical protein